MNGNNGIYYGMAGRHHDRSMSVVRVLLRKEDNVRLPCVKLKTISKRNTLCALKMPTFRLIFTQNPQREAGLKAWLSRAAPWWCKHHITTLL